MWMLSIFNSPVSQLYKSGLFNHITNIGFVLTTLLDKHKPNIAEENKIKQQKLQDQAEMLQRLEQKLKEKEQQLFKELSNKQETIRALEQKLEEQMILTENIQIAARGQLQVERITGLF